MHISNIYVYKSSVPFSFAHGAHFTGPADLLMLTGFWHHKSRKNTSSPQSVGHTWGGVRAVPGQQELHKPPKKLG